MLREFIQQLCKELAVDVPKLNEKKVFPFKLNDNVEVTLKDLEPGVGLQAQICPSPKMKKEEIFIYLMRANLLGQGTGGSRIGMDQDEKFLTLSLGLPYEMNYKIFKETLEDFVNYLIYWRDIVAKFEKDESVY
jgi:hypothetical protein